MASTPTKVELQQTLNDVGGRVIDMLDPSLTRRQIVEGLKELDEMLNGVDDEDDEEADDDSDDSDDSEEDSDDAEDDEEEDDDE